MIGVSQPNIQNILAGASSDGNSLLVLHGCGSDDTMWLYDGDLETGIYTGVDITPQLGGMDYREKHMMLAADGLTLVFNQLTPIGFSLKQRNDRDSTVFLTVSDSVAFVRVNDWAVANTSEIWGPILSGDGLSFFFSAHVSGDPSTTRIYEVIRARRGDAFPPPGDPLPGLNDGNEIGIYAVSTDRLTVFGVDARSWTTTMLVRPRLDAPFSRTDLPVASIRTVPIGDDCDRLLGNGTIGGCSTEEIYVLTPH